MADLVWPATLPQEPKLAGHSEQPPKLTVRTEMDVGPAKVRRRTSAGVRNFSMSIVMTRAQCALLDEFFLDSAQGGALAFQWTHPRTGNLIDYRFTAPPTYNPLGPRSSAAAKWVATFQLEALPGTEIDGTIPPIDPIAIPADISIYVVALQPEITVDHFDMIVLGAVHEADAVPGDIFIGTFIDPGLEEIENAEIAGAALYVSGGGGVIGPGPGGDHGGGGPGGGVQP